MKLGTQTGSLINHLISREAAQMPKVGDGATLLGWTDRTPLTVVAIEGDIVYTTEDSYRRTDSNGMSDAQTYEYTSNLEAHRTAWRLDRQGKWAAVHRNDRGRWVLSGSRGIVFGRRERFLDYSF